MLEQRLEQDIKAALIAGDGARLTVLRGLKATLLNVKVAKGTRGEEMPEAEILALFAKEAKKRQESADMYEQGRAADKAEQERTEKKIIEEYLPQQLSEAEITAIVQEVIAGMDAPNMGQVIGQVKAKAGATADGAVIARIVKEQLA